jgi:hypothetical protein
MLRHVALVRSKAAQTTCKPKAAKKDMMGLAFLSDVKIHYAVKKARGKLESKEHAATP